MFTADDLSVVIPCYNSKSTILACLESLYRQSEAPGEVILVDSSGDDTLDIVAEHYPEVRRFRFSCRMFPGPARNRGVELAKGQVIAFIDADCIAAPDWIARIAAQHAAGHQIVGGAVDLGNPDNALSWAGHLMEFREFLPQGSAHPVTHVPTCNISYRRNLIEAYGGFPDSYYPQEDLLFNHLLNRNGFDIWFDPAIRVKHFCRDSLIGYLSHQHRIGRVTRVTLSRTQMHGSAISRRPWLAWLAAPGLGLLKYLRTTAAFLGFAREDLLKHPGLPLVLLLGSVWWARGFAAGALTGLSGIRGVIDPEENIFIIMNQSIHQHPPSRKSID
jgi:glycosyltransferase involved in cell wall biosynthesis